MPLFLSEQDVRIVLTMDELIPAMEAALKEFSGGTVVQPLRTVLDIGPGKGFYGLMPAHVRSLGAMGSKLVTVFHGNPQVDLPTHLAAIVLHDQHTGELLAVMDGRYITEARTAAVSAVSVAKLARADAASLAIIGSGVQARSHLDAISRVRLLNDVRVWSPNEERRDAFVREMQPRVKALVRPTRSAQEAVQGADVIVLATASRTPVVESPWIADGAHICAVGACRPDQREMDAPLVKRSRLYVDSRTGAAAEAGDVVLAIKDGAIDASHIAGELGEALNGTVPARGSRAEVTLFKSLGMAVEDVAAAHLAFIRATERGLGRGFVF